MRWLIFYDGNRAPWTGAPERAPERGAQAIIQEDETTGWYCLTGHDYYVWLRQGDWSGEWAGVDVFGLFDYLATPGWKRVLFGRTILNVEYERIYAQALAEMGAKSARRRGERA